jgi:hypothetical protein
VPFTNTVVNATTGQLDVKATDTNTGGNDAGVVTQTSPTVLTVTFATINAGTVSALDIQGIRVNASLVPSPTITIAPGTLPAGGITFTGATTALTDAYPVPTLNSVAAQGFVNEGLGFFTNANSTTTIAAAVSVSFNGAQAGLLKAKAQYTADYAAPPTLTAASQGTRLMVTFNNLDANVNYWVPATIGTNVTLVAYNSATGNTAATTSTFTTQLATNASVTLVPLPAPVNGSSVIYYGVTVTGGAGSTVAASAAANSNAQPTDGLVLTNGTGGQLILSETVPTPSAVTAVSATPPTATITLVGVSSGYPEFSATAPTYAAAQGNGATGIITLNATTLIFPYTTNSGGYDTGIAITNASTLPKGVTPILTNSASSASCSATFYGTGVPSTNPYSLGVVATGSIATFDVGTVAPGFSGYIIVTCNFEGAHGYAFITNGLGTGTGVAANYVAPIIAAPGLAGTTAN